MNELNLWWPLLGMAMMRPLGAMLLMPLFSSGMLGGAMVRNALALMATLPVLPYLAPIVVPNPMQSPLAYVLMLASELGVGLLLGFSAAIPFWAVDMAGFVLDTMRGASMAGVLNPMIGGQSSPLGALFSQLAAVFFLSLGGFHAFLSALFDSYLKLPPGQGWHWGAQFIPLLEQQWGLLHSLALRFAMPAVVMLLLVDLALGLINRSAQQLNVFTLSMPIKSAIALLMLIICLPFAWSGLLAQFATFDGGLLHMLEVGR